MAKDHPVVLPSRSPSEMISYALKYRFPATTLLICSTRSAFLDSLTSSIRGNPESHLIHATLHQIMVSRSINIAFLSTLSHLRAYLAVFDPRLRIESPLQTSAKTDTRTSLLLVYGLLGLHRDTSEWSAQGLGSTIASLVEGGSRNGYHIVMCEADIQADFDMVDMNVDGNEENDELQREAQDQNSCWREEIPILNGSTRRMISGNDEASGPSGWAGRTVEVGRVLQRWCVFKDE